MRQGVGKSNKQAGTGQPQDKKRRRERKKRGRRKEERNNKDGLATTNKTRTPERGEDEERLQRQPRGADNGRTTDTRHGPKRPPPRRALEEEEKGKTHTVRTRNPLFSGGKLPTGHRAQSTTWQVKTRRPARFHLAPLLGTARHDTHETAPGPSGQRKLAQPSNLVRNMPE